MGAIQILYLKELEHSENGPVGDTLVKYNVQIKLYRKNKRYVYLLRTRLILNTTLVNEPIFFNSNLNTRDFLNDE